ncbi:MAG: type II toxin-antitoxin system RelE/ParE family toxin [Candidatus Eisenbacteria bacterium]|nr:type II toxin-antitoxin system RelE/ParE family toxin [Candidatus Eisenbacteria bacterium]
MIQSFADRGSEDIYNGCNTKAARAVRPRESWNLAARKMDQLDSAEAPVDLRTPRGNRFEALVGDRKGQHSIRVNERYRLCFRWSENGPTDVGIVDYH